jgi:4-amino-4-deoxy-L-arabinose transferase-like glycosyltransferase
VIKFFSTKENLLVIFILVIASVLRLWDLFSIPFTYDEFSAVFRTRFNDFSTLIDDGVKIDPHPAGVQIFLFYWVNWFGEIAWIVKLPFILCGIYSVYLTYKLGKLWFPETTALLAMASMATLQYPVMYSQIARPYAMGMLTCVGMGYCWSKIIQLKDHWRIKWQIGFIAGRSCC